MVRVVFIFVDGLGVGEKDPRINPCARASTRIFSNFLPDQTNREMPFGGKVLFLDATLGIDGIPQSATGQTTLLTGVNAPKLLGRHLNGFPNQKLRDILAEKSILKRFKEMGRRVCFLNAYRPLFFQLEEAKKWRLSATTVANLAAGLPFFGLKDVVEERALYQDFTNQELIARGFDVPLFSPRKAGKILAQASKTYDFCLFEYFQTDRAGHSMDMSRAIGEISKLEGFLLSFLEEVKLSETLLLLASDHGNLEDISVKIHTRNPALLILWGKASEEIANKIKSIEDITPVLLSLRFSRN